MCKAGDGTEWSCDHPPRRQKSGVCGGHAAQLRRGVELRPLRVQAWGGRPSQRHLPCTFEGCPKLRVNAGLCSGHVAQRAKGQALRPLRSVEPHPFLPGWNRAWPDKNRGYMQVNQTVGGRRVAEHRAVMEWVLGRELRGSENVHHINGVRDDNRPENLEIWSTLQPAGQRIPDKVAHAWEIIAMYDPHLEARPDKVRA